MVAAATPETLKSDPSPRPPFPCLANPEPEMYAGNGMAHAIPNPPPGFDGLSVEEKLDYVQSLWDRIAAKPETVPVPDWHLEVIDERLARSRGERGAGRTWDEVREEIRAKLRSRRPTA
jgi:putative addiction module component (TIGR02574 family)